MQDVRKPGVIDRNEEIPVEDYQIRIANATNCPVLHL